MKNWIFAVAVCWMAMGLGAAELPRLGDGFELDGRFSAAKWAGAMSVAFTNREATAWLGRTENDLYVGVVSRHGRMSGRVCLGENHDDPVYNSDTAEVFVGVPGREGFWHVIANVKGTVYDEYKDDLGRVALDWDSGARAAGSYDEANDSYYIEMRLPLAVYSPIEGRITLAVCSYTRWNQNGKAALGEYFRPDTWTAFELGAKCPVVLEKLTVPVVAGRQTCAVTISNRSSDPIELKGTFADESVAWTLGGGDTRTFEAFNRMRRGDKVEVALKLDANGRRILEAYRNLVAQPLLKAVPTSDVIWSGEPLRLKVTVFEKQTEPVEVEVLPDRAKCTYKGETVDVPYSTDPSPWGK